MLADMAATTFAMEAVADLALAMADLGDRDIRLEAAVAKMWNTEEGWKIVDRTMQIRGGRGYETARLAARPRRGADSGRAHDARLPHQPDLRGLVRDHAPLHRARGGGQAPRSRRRLRRPEGAARRRSSRRCRGWPRFYAWWYPTRWLGWGRWPRYSEFGPLAGHVRFVERTTRRLARTIFHQMLRHGPKLEKRQALLFRAVDIGADLFAMAAALSRADGLRALRRGRGARGPRELADVFCRTMRAADRRALPRRRAPTTTSRSTDRRDPRARRASTSGSRRA